MISAISTAPRSRRRTTTAVLVAALLGIAALLAISPRSAPAAPDADVPCADGEFCLYYLDDLNGGRYHYTGSDSNLGNDLFEDGEGSEFTVSNRAASVWNNGANDPNDRIDVLVYTGRGFKGQAGCVHQDQSGDLREGFANKIQSYRWVTPARCSEEVTAVEPILNQP